MQIMLVYGTNEGHTQKIAAFVANHLERRGHHVTTANASDARTPPDPHGFDAISARANGFLSVSLAAAGHEPDDIGGLKKCVADFVQATGWTPRVIHHVAGAFRYTAYGFLTRCVMRYIAYRKGAPTDTHHDYELTDWDDLTCFADRFAAAAAVTRA